MHTKDFEGWNQHKQNLHSKTGGTHLFNEREIWWCSIGVNIGDEEDGHNSTYNRPVLIVKKFNNRIFWGVPTTKQVKESKFYFPIEFKGLKQCVMLSHLRLYDSRRLENKRGKLSHDQFEAVREELKMVIYSAPEGAAVPSGNL